MASPNLTALATTTLRNRNKELADNVSNGNALWNRLSQKGKIKLIDGGRTIVEELAYAENSTFQYYNGYEVLNIAPSDVISAAEFNWKQASTSVTISGLEGVVQNSGKEKVISLVDARITNAIDTMANNLSTGIYSDGSGSNGKQIGGLQLLVADSPSTGIVGGINRANYSFWQNKVTSFAALSLTPGSTTIQAAMNNMWLQTVRGNDKTDLIVADTTYYTYYWTSLQAIQRITDSNSTASAGFMSLKYQSADVMYDGDSGLPSNHMYFLNTKYLYLKVHKDRNLVPATTADGRQPVNQDATIIPILWAGNLTASNCARQGVLKA